MTIDSDFLAAQIVTTKALVVAAQELQLLLMSEDTPTQKSYTLNTGQTIISVTKADMPRVNAVVDSLYNRLATLCARTGAAGTGGGQAVPGW